MFPASLFRYPETSSSSQWTSFSQWEPFHEYQYLHMIEVVYVTDNCLSDFIAFKITEGMWLDWPTIEMQTHMRCCFRKLLNFIGTSTDCGRNTGGLIQITIEFNDLRKGVVVLPFFTLEKARVEKMMEYINKEVCKRIPLVR